MAEFQTTNLTMEHFPFGEMAEGSRDITSNSSISSNNTIRFMSNMSDIVCGLTAPREDPVQAFPTNVTDINGTPSQTTTGSSLTQELLKRTYHLMLPLILWIEENDRGFYMYHAFLLGYFLGRAWGLLNRWAWDPHRNPSTQERPRLTHLVAMQDIYGQTWRTRVPVGNLNDWFIHNFAPNFMALLYQSKTFAILFGLLRLIRHTFDSKTPRAKLHAVQKLQILSLSLVYACSDVVLWFTLICLLRSLLYCMVCIVRQWFDDKPSGARQPAGNQQSRRDPPFGENHSPRGGLSGGGSQQSRGRLFGGTQRPQRVNAKMIVIGPRERSRLRKAFSESSGSEYNSNHNHGQQDHHHNGGNDTENNDNDDDSHSVNNSIRPNHEKGNLDPNTSPGVVETGIESIHKMSRRFEADITQIQAIISELECEIQAERLEAERLLYPSVVGTGIESIHDKMSRPVEAEEISPADKAERDRELIQAEICEIQAKRLEAEQLLSPSVVGTGSESIHDKTSRRVEAEISPADKAERDREIQAEIYEMEYQIQAERLEAERLIRERHHLKICDLQRHVMSKYRDQLSNQRAKSPESDTWE